MPPLPRLWSSLLSTETGTSVPASPMATSTVDADSAPNPDDYAMNSSCPRAEKRKVAERG